MYPPPVVVCAEATWPAFIFEYLFHSFSIVSSPIQATHYRETLKLILSQYYLFPCTAPKMAERSSVVRL